MSPHNDISPAAEFCAAVGLLSAIGIAAGAVVVHVINTYIGAFL